MMDKYKIGDFAANLGVTPDLLKHYEKHNIINSEKRGEGGYRYYHLTQVPQILESKKFQKLGFKLREIENMLHHNSIDTLVDSLIEKTEALADEISDKQLVLHYAQHLCTLLRDIQNDNFDGKWYIGKIGSRYFFPHSKGYNFAPISRSVRDQLSNWINSIPVVEQCSRITFHNKKYSDLTFGLSINSEHAETLNLYVEDPVEEINESWGLIYQSSQVGGNPKEQDFINRVLERPLHVLEKHRLTPNGDILIRTLLETLDNGGKYYHRIIMIPLESE
ncbi:MerR family transcriptional regulator [Paenibacillus dakarensis]|uniref:MerR family transcriptional regulator n=1 Tax=Paenibacillus dakarensis TaxID=1527293 RepID=UPI0006D56272|nr:MerR family transcriptional regulator [Paenibacillus dakarensis]